MIFHTIKIGVTKIYDGFCRVHSIETEKKSRSTSFRAAPRAATIVTTRSRLVEPFLNGEIIARLPPEGEEKVSGDPKGLRVATPRHLSWLDTP